jgi:hypothetical protein
MATKKPIARVSKKMRRYKIAQQIAERLFMSGGGPGNRLEIKAPGPDGERGMGGWAKSVVEDHVRDILAANGY